MIFHSFNFQHFEQQERERCKYFEKRKERIEGRGEILLDVTVLTK